MAMAWMLGVVLVALLLAGCTGGDVASRRPSATAPRDWAARRNLVTGGPLLERRDDAGVPALAPVPTTPETRYLPPPGTPRA
jgi:hypothetical protein